MAGLLPTEMINFSYKDAYVVGMNDLLYIGGLRDFLEHFIDKPEDSGYDFEEFKRIHYETTQEEVSEESKIEEVKIKQWISNFTEEQLGELEKKTIHWKTPFVEWIESNKYFNVSIYELLTDDKIFKRFWDVYLERMFELKLVTSYTKEEAVIKEYDLLAQSIMDSLDEEGCGCSWNSYHKSK